MNSDLYILFGNGSRSILVVEPLETPKNTVGSNAIANTMETIANTKMILHHPADPEQFLKEYYEEKDGIYRVRLNSFFPCLDSLPMDMAMSSSKLKSVLSFSSYCAARFFGAAFFFAFEGRLSST